MELEGHPKTPRDREVQNDQIKSSPNEMVAEEPEVILITAPQVQVPQELSGLPLRSLDEDCVEDIEIIL